MGPIILLVVIAITVLLGRYALAEGHRIERQKKFTKNMNNYESGRSKNDPVNIWNNHKRKK